MNEMPKIEGVNLEDGLKRLRNNTVLYKKLLHSFFDYDMIPTLAKNVRENDVKAVRLQAHSIKGAASNLGLNLISETAALIDSILKDNNAEITEEVNELLDKLTVIMLDTEKKINMLDL